MLGKVESEYLVTTVDGIDVVVAGRNVPVLQKGRLIKNTVAVYGGEQGQHIGRTVLTLDGARNSSRARTTCSCSDPRWARSPRSCSS
jgi:2',3'-cyclic-nucleotide 2'-phosphodiesterase (5'-nucleotidase family)